jgi:ribose transport system substrate-binding protein
MTMRTGRNTLRLRTLIVFFVLALVAAACSDSDGDETTTTAGGEGETTSTAAGEADTGSPTIGFAISSFDNDFFVSLRDGVEGAAVDAGATVTISDAGGDAATQASQVEDFITQGVDLIMVNPVDSDAIVPSVEAANAAGIPVIAVDRGSSGGDIASFVASDNVLGGTMAGEYLFEQMGGSGEVLELQGIIGTSAAQDRGDGFQIALDAAPDIDRVAQQTANFARDEGLTVTENLLQANSDATGLFAHNDDMALGAVEAAAAAGLDLIIVGFDAAPDALQAVADGDMAGTIAQQPVLMGQLALEAALGVIAGDTVSPVIAVPVALVTPDNVADFL